MEYEKIKTENKMKKLVQEAQEKVTFPSFLLPLQPLHVAIHTAYVTEPAKINYVSTNYT